MPFAELIQSEIAAGAADVTAEHDRPVLRCGCPTGYLSRCAARRAAVRQVTFLDAQHVVRRRLESNHPHKANHAEKDKAQNDNRRKARANDRAIAKERWRSIDREAAYK